MIPDEPSLPSCLRVLVTNDDGIESPGVHALADELAQMGAEVTVVCPDREMSGAGQSHTLRRPVRLVRVPGPTGRSWCIRQGTPVDCVDMAVRLWGPFDYVVSGVNAGANLGDHVYYSGTAGAAWAASRQGIPALAVSLVRERDESWEWQSAARVTSKLIEEQVLDGHGRRCWLNVNVPNKPWSELNGWCITRLAAHFSHPPALAVECRQPDAIVATVRLKDSMAASEEGTDIAAVAHGFISVTVLAARPFSDSFDVSPVGLPKWPPRGEREDDR